MIRVRPFAVPFLAFGIAITSSVTLASTLEEEYIALAGWCPGLAGPSIQDEHGQWHTIGFGATQGKEFVEFHDEFLAQSDDFRLYGSDLDAADPDAAVIPVVAQAGSVLKFAHTNLNGCVRPAGDNVTLAHAHVGPCGVASAWTPRPADLRLRNVLFHGYDANGIGGAMDGLFHGAGHGTIAAHNRVGAANGDMGFTTTATRDGAFFQWHKNIDNIYHEWAVGQYQGVANTGTPIFFSVVNTAVGAGVGAGASALRLRRETNEYQGTNPPVDVDFDGVLDQYGAIPRIPSDIYVGDINSSNLLFDYGIRRWNTLDAWDKDAFTILNPPGSGWYFSVTTTSVGALLTAVNAQAAAARGECVFESAGAGTNTLYRTGPDLGLLAAASDNLDALEVDQQKRIQATNDSNIAGIYDRPKQWFSLRSGSEFGVKALGGAAVGPCDILQFNANGDLVIAVAAATLGLGAGDELDALVIVDTAPFDTLNGTDLIYYSLVTGNPGLGGASGADILCKTVAGGACAGVGHAALGLLATDDLDALDVELSPTGKGACCHANGTCTEVPQANCNAPGDVFGGPETVCAAANCGSPGACCLPNGTCNVVSSETACLTAGGTFRGAGTTCATVTCPRNPGNDECAYGYQIPYNYSDYYAPDGYYMPAGDTTYATTQYPDEYPNIGYPPYGPPYTPPYDPPYGCADHETFFPPYGTGSVWYTYDVPPYQPQPHNCCDVHAGPGCTDPGIQACVCAADPACCTAGWNATCVAEVASFGCGSCGYTRSIGIYPQATYDTYQQSYQYGDYGYGYGYDTRVGIYYAPTGDCYNLQPVACGDNYYSSYNPPYPPSGGYQNVEYYNPPPGRYYIQVSSTGDVNRGAIRLQVRDPQQGPVLGGCCNHGQCQQGLPPEQCRQEGGVPVSQCSPSAPCENQIPPGQDCFHTQCGRTYYDFMNTPIPSDFYDPGSGSYEGKVLLGGDSPDGMDTRMNRLNLMVFPVVPSTATTPVELVALSLRSCAPITVKYCGTPGHPDEQWEVHVDLSTLGPPPPAGLMYVTKTHANGGVFTSQFHVQPVFTFTRVGDGAVRVLDTGAAGYPPVMLDSTDQAPWVHYAHVPIQPDCGGYNFVPGVQDSGSLPGGGGCVSPTQCCKTVGHDGPGHLHETGKTCTPCPCGACCNPADGSCTLVSGLDPAAACAALGGQFKGVGTTCADSDGDGIPDAYETNNCCSGGNCGTKTLCSYPTDPTRADTDGDGLNDKVDPFPCNRCLPLGAPNRPPICDQYDLTLPGDGDCDNDGICDLCEILTGGSYDCDENLIPDEAQVTCTRTVVGRLLFYNGSFYDSASSACSTLTGVNPCNDNTAIASDKVALNPGGTATTANYSSYSRSINGLMIDVARTAGCSPLPAGPMAASNFEFRIANSANLGSYVLAASPISIDCTPGGGTGGSDRIKIIWSNNAIPNTRWLRTRVKSQANGGIPALGADNVFYYGVAMGESLTPSGTRAIVSSTDEIDARNHPHNSLAANRVPVATNSTYAVPNAPDAKYDYDKSSTVSSTDEIIARNNPTNSINGLLLLNPAP